MTKLTWKQERFVEEYLKDPNATQAALLAGYSERTAARMGSENLHKPLIKAELHTRREKLAENTGVTPERVIEELAKIGFANMQDYITVEGKTATVDLSKLTRDQAAAITEVTSDTIGGDDGMVMRTKIKLGDKRGALQDLCKHFGLFAAEKLDVTVKGDVERLIAERRAGSIERASQTAVH